MRSIIYIVLTTVAAGLTMQSCVKKTKGLCAEKRETCFLKAVESPKHTLTAWRMRPTALLFFHCVKDMMTR